MKENDKDIDNENYNSLDEVEYFLSDLWNEMKQNDNKKINDDEKLFNEKFNKKIKEYQEYSKKKSKTKKL